jgi:AraC-like DNA-binding protein
MRKEMNLTSFDLFKYLKNNLFKTSSHPYLLVDDSAYKFIDVRFPMRNFFYGVGLTYAGKDKVRIAHEEVTIQAGSLILIGPGTISQWLNESRSTTETFLFIPEFFKDFMSPAFLSRLPFFLPGGNHVIQLDTSEMEQMTSVFKTVKQFAENRPVVEGIAYAMLMLCSQFYDQQHTGASRTTTRKQKIARDFRSLVAQHYLKKRTVEFYARKLNITPKYLSEVMLSEVGKPAKFLIDESVFLEAKTLLRQTTMTVQEIAYWLEFADASNFTKAFRKRESITPLEYRKFQ